MGKRTVDLFLSIIASAVALLLSWPYLRDFEYWPESRLMWVIYFIIGFGLAVYVFYVFLVALHTLFEHDALDHATTASAETNANGKEDQS